MKISKNYIGYESKSISDYETGLTSEEAKSSLNHIEKSWKRLDGVIVDKDEISLTVEESNGEGRIVFNIEDEELTYDVHFNDSENSNNKGFKESLDYCKDYIETHNGTNHGYFADYKGGSVSIVCSDGETVFETPII